MTPTTRRHVTEAYYVLWANHRIAPRIEDVIKEFQSRGRVSLVGNLETVSR